MSSSVTICNGLGAVYGVPNNELGVNIEEFAGDLTPELIETLKGNNGCVRSVAYGSCMLDLKMSFEINAPNTANSITESQLAVAFIPLNQINVFSQLTPTTGLYFQKGTFVFNRSGFYKGTADTKAYAGVP